MRKFKSFSVLLIGLIICEHQVLQSTFAQQMFDSSTDTMDITTFDETEIMPPGEESIEFGYPGDSNTEISSTHKTGIANDEAPPKSLPQVKSIALYVLSRGQGVSKEALEILAKFRGRIEEAGTDVVSKTEERFGIEGETRICAEFVNEAIAKAIWEYVYNLAKNADLINMRVENCIRK